MLRKIFVAASLGAMLVLGSAANSAQAGGNYYGGRLLRRRLLLRQRLSRLRRLFVRGIAGYSGCCNTIYNPYYPPVEYVYPSPPAVVVAPAPRIIYSAPVGPCVRQPATDDYGRPISVVKAGC